jgi:mono/diheme cytochrome c family protein
MGIFGGFVSGHHFSDATDCARSIATLGPGRRIRACLGLILLALLFSTYTLGDSGAETYKTKCSACHGANGAGDTMIGRNLNLRALGSADAQRQSDDELFTIISRGKNKNRMPSFDRKLSKEQIRDVVRYIRTLKK